jgi:predicted outer membrane protein
LCRQCIQWLCNSATAAAVAGRFINEVVYHKTVNSALQNTLIPPQLKDLLTTGLKIFQGHEQHAEHVAAEFK